MNLTEGLSTLHLCRLLRRHWRAVCCNYCMYTDETETAPALVQTSTGPAVTHAMYPSHEKTSPVNSWTSQDIDAWL